MANGNSKNGLGSLGKYDVLIRTVKEFGMPTALVAAFMYIGVNYWIGPQTELLKQMTKNNATQVELIQTMSESNAVTNQRLKDIQEVGKEQLTELKQQAIDFKNFYQSVVECHEDQTEKLDQLLDK